MTTHASARVVLVTGASSGIGLDAARGLRDRGWRVFATARKPDDLDRLESENLQPLRLDYTDPDSVAGACQTLLDRTGGRIDAVFNNGAHATPGALEDLPRDALRAIFEANLFGPHDLTRRLIPAMRAQGHGRIVNCSSVLGFTPMMWRGAYVSTKFALTGLTHTLRLEMADTPIKIILIEPGPITSRIRENAIPHFERWIDWKASPRAEDYQRTLLKRLYEDRGKDAFELPASAVTRKLIHALEHPRPRARYFVTTPTYLMAAIHRLLPQRAIDAILRRG